MIIHYIQKKRRKCDSSLFFCKVLELNINTYIKKRRKERKSTRYQHHQFFLCWVAAWEAKEREEKNRNQRVSLSRSSFRGTNALYSTWLGALVRLRSPPSSLEFNFFFSFSLSCIRPLEIGFFLFCSMCSLPGQFSSSSSWVDGSYKE